MPFSSETFDFLIENRLQNSRSWFAEHKKEYQEYVRKPLLFLAEQLEDSALAIDPELVTAPSRVISRVNRDTRFTKDKSLYRDVMWCAYTRDKKVYDTPCALVIELSPMGFRYGCGYWKTPAPVMESVRELVLANDPSFQNVERMLQRHPELSLEGERYKRSRYPEQPEILQGWLNLKTISVMHNSKDFDLLFSDRFPLVLQEGFRSLEPFYVFLRKAEENANMRHESL